MLDEDNILKQFTRKEDILKIFNFIKSNRIIKTSHFHDRLLMRDLSEELVNKILPQKDRIKLIDKRKHKKDIGYDLYYELNKTQTLKLCFIHSSNKILLVNAILKHMKWKSLIRHLNIRKTMGHLT